MATSLYDLSVPTFLQTLSAVAGFLDHAAAHCAKTGGDPDDLVHARLFADMAPFHFQIEALTHHSVWGLEAIRTGAIQSHSPDEVNGWADKALDLQIGPRRLAFTPDTYLLSFALPNFHFHAVTAYDILRTRGVPLGKRDYEGRLRTRPA